MHSAGLSNQYILSSCCEHDTDIERGSFQCCSVMTLAFSFKSLTTNTPWLARQLYREFKFWNISYIRRYGAALYILFSLIQSPTLLHTKVNRWISMSVICDFIFRIHHSLFDFSLNYFVYDAILWIRYIKIYGFYDLDAMCLGKLYFRLMCCDASALFD